MEGLKDLLGEVITDGDHSSLSSGLWQECQTPEFGLKLAIIGCHPVDYL